MDDHSSDSGTSVVLLPGLWMPAGVMIPLECRISRCGFRTARFAYASARSSLRQNVIDLARYVEAKGCTSIHLVGHSLGGLVALHATASLALKAVRRIVLVGSPYVDSHAARELGQSRLGRWMLGACVPEWLACDKFPVPADVEVGVIAGTASFGLGTLVAPDLPRPNDGVVSVSETAVAGMKASVLVPVSHSRMLISRRIGKLVCNFLHSGGFESAVDRQAGPAA